MKDRMNMAVVTGMGCRVDSYSFAFVKGARSGKIYQRERGRERGIYTGIRGVEKKVKHVFVVALCFNVSSFWVLCRRTLRQPHLSMFGSGWE